MVVAGGAGPVDEAIAKGKFGVPLCLARESRLLLSFEFLAVEAQLSVPSRIAGCAR